MLFRSLDNSIAAIQEQISQLSAASSGSATRITAPSAGLFSSLVDGYEEVLNLETIEALTPSSYRSIAPVAGTSGVGKMVYGERWSFVTVLRSQDLGKLAVGDTITLRFQKGLDRDMTMTVQYISQEEDGKQVVAFTSEKYLNLTTLLRRQNALVIFESYTGIRVPRSSVRVEQSPLTDEDGEPLLDADGQQKTEPVTCVYCMWGEFARRKPVQILWQEEEYILVEADTTALNAISAESVRESRRLRAGDPVITSAAEIYDGMVIK